MKQEPIFKDFRGALVQHAETLAQEHEAIKVRARQRRRRRTLLGGGIAVASFAATLVVVFGLTGSGRLNTVEEARAALVPGRGILHMKTVVRSTTGLTDPRNWGPDFVSEQWVATDPLRWRTVQQASPDGRGSLILGYREQHGPVDGAFETAYAGGVVKTYAPSRNTLDITIGMEAFEEENPETAPFGALAVEQPLRTLGAALAEGQLRDAGPATLGGRSARRLVGTLTGPTLVGQRMAKRVEVEAFVDSESFVPLRTTFTNEYGEDEDLRTNVSEITFEVYEQLPLTPENARLLEVQPAPGTQTFQHP